MDPQIMDDSGFWQFSPSFYGDEQVAEACLLLQDEAAADVNVLLFMLWRATPSAACYCPGRSPPSTKR